MLSRQEAIELIRQQRVQVLALALKVPPGLRTEPLLGDWSLKDLLGHLESWDQHILDAPAAWSRDERAPLDEAVYIVGLSQINAAEVERRSQRSFEQQLASSQETHARL